MNMKKTSAILLATTLSFAGISYATAANQTSTKTELNCQKQSGEMGQGKHHGKKKNKGMGFSKLDLTDAQKLEISEIMKSVKGDKKGQKSESKMAHRASMQALVSSDSFDEDAAKALINIQQAEKAEKQLAMLKAKNEAFQLLTDEQKVKYSELKTQGKNR